MTINYRDLLRRYIFHVVDIGEGMDYIADFYRTKTFTPEEWRELERLAEEADATLWMEEQEGGDYAI